MVVSAGTRDGGDNGLYYGSVISLREVNYLAPMSGDTNREHQVVVQHLKSHVHPAVPPDEVSCRFEVCGKHQYTSQREFLRTLNEHGLSRATYAADEKVRENTQLCVDLNKKSEKMAEEQRMNVEEQARLVGEPVLYGQTVQLRHVATGSFIKVKAQSAFVDRGSLMVSMEEYGDLGSWLRVYPGYKTKADGEQVTFGDLISLVSTEIGQTSLGVIPIPRPGGTNPSGGSRFAGGDEAAGAQGGGGGGRTESKELARRRHEVQRMIDHPCVTQVLEVAAFSHGSQWTVQPCSTPEEIEERSQSAERQLVKGGDCVKLWHQATDTYAEIRGDDERVCFTSVGTSNRDVQVGSWAGDQTHIGANAIWQIELNDTEWTGSPLQPSSRQTLRLKHVVSGKYMTGSAVVDDSGAVDFGVQVMLDYSEPMTIWKLQPFQRSDSQMATSQALIYIQNATSDLYLSCNDGGDGGAEAKKKQGLPISLDEATASVGDGPVDVVHDASLSSERSIHILRLKKVDKAVVNGINNLRGMPVQFDGFIAALNDESLLNEQSNDQIMTHTEKCFNAHSNTATFALDAVTAPLRYRQGHSHSIKQYQTLLREIRVIDAVLESLASIDFVAILDTDATRSMSYAERYALTETVKVYGSQCHVFLQLACKDNITNKNYVAEYTIKSKAQHFQTPAKGGGRRMIDMLLNQLRTPIGAVKTLDELFKENNHLIRKLEKDQIKLFIDIIQGNDVANEINDIYCLRVLQTLCGTSTAPHPKNQIHILQNLLNPVASTDDSHKTQRKDLWKRTILTTEWRDSSRADKDGNSQRHLWLKWQRTSESGANAGAHRVAQQMLRGGASVRNVVKQEELNCATFLRAHTDALQDNTPTVQKALKAEIAERKEMDETLFHPEATRDDGKLKGKADLLVFWYHIEMLQLFTATLLGLNKGSENLLIKYRHSLLISYSDLLEVVKSDEMPWSLRHASLELLRGLYIKGSDVLETSNPMKTVRVMPAAMTRSTILQSKTAGGNEEHDSKYEVERRFDENNQAGAMDLFPSLIEFMSEFLEGLNGNVDFANLGRNQLLMAVLETILEMMHLGALSHDDLKVLNAYVSTKDGTRNKRKVLVEILDGRNDRNDTAADVLNRFGMGRNLDVPLRVRLCHEITLQIKLFLCRMCTHLADVELERVADQLFTEFASASDKDGEEMFHQSSDGQDDDRFAPKLMKALSFESSRVQPSALYLPKRVRTFLRDAATDQPLVDDDVTLDLIRYKDMNLMTEAFILLYDMQSECTRIHRAISPAMCQVIIPDVPTHDINDTIIRSKKSLLKEFRHVEDADEEIRKKARSACTRIIDGLTQVLIVNPNKTLVLCHTCNQDTDDELKQGLRVINCMLDEGSPPVCTICSNTFTAFRSLDQDTVEMVQNLMREAHVHKVIVNLLQLPLLKEYRPAEKVWVALDTGLRNLFVSCYRCLNAFMSGSSFRAPNSNNQNALFDHFNMFLDHVGIAGLNVSDSLSSFFISNRQLAEALDENVIIHYIKLLGLHGDKRHARFLRFLRRIIIVDGVPIRETQDTLITLLDRQKQESILLLGDTVSFEGEPRSFDISFMKQLLMLENADAPGALGEHMAALGTGSMLRYHYTCVMLLADCCIRNEPAVVKANAMLDIKVLIDVLRQRVVEDEVRTHASLIFMQTAYMSFLDKAYFSVDGMNLVLDEVRNAKNRIWLNPEFKKTWSSAIKANRGAIENVFKSKNDAYDEGQLKKDASEGTLHSSVVAMVTYEMKFAVLNENHEAVLRDNTATYFLIAAAFPAMTAYFQNHYVQSRRDLPYTHGAELNTFLERLKSFAEHYLQFPKDSLTQQHSDGWTATETLMKTLGKMNLAGEENKLFDTLLDGNDGHHGFGDDEESDDEADQLSSKLDSFSTLCGIELGKTLHEEHFSSTIKLSLTDQNSILEEMAIFKIASLFVPRRSKSSEMDDASPSTAIAWQIPGSNPPCSYRKAASRIAEFIIGWKNNARVSEDIVCVYIRVMCAILYMDDPHGANNLSKADYNRTMARLFDMYIKDEPIIHSKYPKSSAVMSGLRRIKGAVVAGLGSSQANNLHGGSDTSMAYDPKAAEVLTWVQNKYSDVGFTQAAVEMLRHPSPKVRMHALQLLSLLLQGGNRNTQDALHGLLKHDADNHFFTMIRNQFSRMQEEIEGKDIDVHSHTDGNSSGGRKFRSSKLDKKHLENLKGAAIGTEIASKAFLSVVKVLQLMSDGANTRSQEMLRIQPYSMSNIDVLEEAVKIVEMLHPELHHMLSEAASPPFNESLSELDEYSIRLMADMLISVLNMLRESVQGPCPSNQVALVSTTNLMDVVNRILEGHNLQKSAETHLRELHEFGGHNQSSARQPSMNDSSQMERVSYRARLQSQHTSLLRNRSRNSFQRTASRSQRWESITKPEPGSKLTFIHDVKSDIRISVLDLVLGLVEENPNTDVISRVVNSLNFKSLCNDVRAMVRINMLSTRVNAARSHDGSDTSRESAALLDRGRLSTRSMFFAAGRHSRASFNVIGATSGGFSRLSTYQRNISSALDIDANFHACIEFLLNYRVVSWTKSSSNNKLGKEVFFIWDMLTRLNDRYKVDHPKLCGVQGCKNVAHLDRLQGVSLCFGHAFHTFDTYHGKNDVLQYMKQNMSTVEVVRDNKVHTVTFQLTGEGKELRSSKFGQAKVQSILYRGEETIETNDERLKFTLGNIKHLSDMIDIRSKILHRIPYFVKVLLARKTWIMSLMFMNAVGIFLLITTFYGADRREFVTKYPEIDLIETVLLSLQIALSAVNLFLFLIEDFQVWAAGTTSSIWNVGNTLGLGVVRQAFGTLTVVVENIARDPSIMKEGTQEADISTEDGLLPLRPPPVPRTKIEPWDFVSRFYIDKLLVNSHFQYYTTLLLCSLLALYQSTFFVVAFFTIFVVEFSRARMVARALIVGAPYILVTGCVGTLLVFVFAVLTFQSFRNTDSSGTQTWESPFDTDSEPCTTLYQCVGTHMIVAFTGANFNELFTNFPYSAVDQVPETITSHGWGQFRNVIITAFSILWTVVLSNIFTGQVVDAFNQMRATREKREQQLEDCCFLCRHRRYEFDRLSPGCFQEHIDQEHNVLDYVCFLHSLRWKNRADHDGLDAHIERLVDQDDARWLPLDKSARLEKFEWQEQQAEEDANNRITDALATIQVEHAKSYAAMEERLRRLEEHSHGLQRKLLIQNNTTSTPTT